MINPLTKCVASPVTELKGVAKSRKWGGLEWLGSPKVTENSVIR